MFRALSLSVLKFQVPRRSVVGKRCSGRRLFRYIVIITLVRWDCIYDAYVADIIDSYSYLQVVRFDLFAIIRVNKDPVLRIRLSSVSIDD